MKNIKKNIIITGSSSGIGKSLREYYENHGDVVIGISNDSDDFVCDVSDKEALSKVFEEIKVKYDHIDILINCAGFGISGAIELIDEKVIQKEYDVNVLGSVYAIQLALPILSERGKIINISSVCALYPLPFRAFYCSSKSAISMISDCLRMELCKTKIQVTAICPCEIKTNFSKNRQKSYDTNERYGKAIELTAKQIDSREDKRMPLDKATQKMVKMINKKKLKPQYIMGARNKFFYHLQKFFPKSWFLKVMTKIFYIEK